MYKEIVETYKDNNKLVNSVGSVLFGSTYSYNFPLYELLENSFCNAVVINRSVKSLSINNAIEIFKECVLDIKPNKLFVNLGEEDLENNNLFKEYSLFIKFVKENLNNCTIYVLPIINSNNKVKELNSGLKKLCIDEKVNFIPIEKLINYNKAEQYKKLYNVLKNYFRNSDIKFIEAFL